MRETEEMSEGETDTDVDSSTDSKTDSDEGQLSLAKVVPLECVRISDPGKRGQESYYFPRRQVLPETYKGIFAYGHLDGDTEHPYGYIYLRPSDKDAYDTIAIARPHSSMDAYVRHVEMPTSSYASNAAKRLRRIHHVTICDILAYLEGVPHFPHGVPIPWELAHDLSSLGFGEVGEGAFRYPGVEELIATALLFVSHSRLNTSKTLKNLGHLEKFITPAYARRMQPNALFHKLQPPRLPYYPAQFRPDEPRDPEDTVEMFAYNGCLSRRSAFRFFKYLPKYASILGLATATTIEMLTLHCSNKHLPPLPPDANINWDNLCHPQSFSDLFEHSPREMLDLVGHGGDTPNKWSPHVAYILNCRRQIRQLMELYEMFFRALGLSGLSELFQEVLLNTFTDDHPDILTTDEAIYFTAAYDFFLREHHHPLAQELLTLLSLPFPHAWDLMLLQQYLVDRIAPPSNISAYDPDYFAIKEDDGEVAL